MIRQGVKGPRPMALFLHGLLLLNQPLLHLYERPGDVPGFPVMFAGRGGR